MTVQTFKIRKVLLIPLGVCSGGLLFLLILALLGNGSGLERFVLAAIAVVMVAFFLLARDRRIAFTDQGIVIRKFFRVKEILRDDINHVGCVILRKRVYLLLTTTKGFFILSNAYEDFSTLIRKVIDYVDTEKVEEDVRALAKSPVKNRADVILLWVAATVICVIIISKLFAA